MRTTLFLATATNGQGAQKTNEKPIYTSKILLIMSVKKSTTI